MRSRLILTVYTLCALIIFMIPILSEGIARREVLLSSYITEKTEHEAIQPHNELGIKDSDILYETEADKVREVPKTDVESGDKNENQALTVSVWLPDEERVAELSIEELVRGIVAAEMPYTFCTEALKAQAVAARTYVLYKISCGSDEEAHHGAQICGDYSHCLAYISDKSAIERWGESAATEIMKVIGEATQATKGEILTYNGNLISSVFHSSSYIRTEDAENVWGWEVPYLKSVATPESDSISEITVSSEYLNEVMECYGENTNTYLPVMSRAVMSVETGESGRVTKLRLGTQTIEAVKLRSVLGLRSCRFEVTGNGESWTFTVHGYGHGVGMSQYGANEYASRGWDYRKILTNYYSGTQITDYPG